jgi:hypothetical protein
VIRAVRVLLLACLVHLCQAQAVTIGQAAVGFAPAAGGGFALATSAEVAEGLRSFSTLMGGSATIADSVAVYGPAGSLPVVATEAVTALEVGGAIARYVALGSAPALAATAAYGVYQVYRCYNPGSVPGSLAGSGFLDCDPGQNPVSTSGGPYFSIGSNYGAASSYGSFLLLVSNNAARIGPATSTGPNGEETRFACYGTNDTYASGCSPNGGGNFSTTYHATGGGAVQSCPASVDALNSAYNVAAGAPVGADGKCPTARYNHTPTSPADAAAKLVASPPAASSYVTGTSVGAGLAKALWEAIKGGQTVQAAPNSLTGPASQTGPTSTTTTTGPSGTTTTTTNNTYNYTYTPTTINYRTDTTTSDGTTTTTTTGTTTTAGAPAPDPKDPCTSNPGRVGCTSLGDPGNGDPAWSSRPVTYAEESLGISGACPAPATFTLLGHAELIGGANGYAPICNNAPYIATTLLMLTTLAGLMWVIVEVNK